MVVLGGGAFSYERGTPVKDPGEGFGTSQQTNGSNVIPRRARPGLAGMGCGMIMQWLQRHTEAGSSWPSWPMASYHAAAEQEGWVSGR